MLGIGSILRAKPATRRSLTFSIVGLALASTPRPSLALPQYTITDLGKITPWDINDRGQITGNTRQAGGIDRAVLYENGTVTDLGTPPGAYSYGYSINSSGQIVGNYFVGNAVHSFLYSGGQLTDLPALPGRDMYPNAINDHGEIVGAALDANSTHAFMYSNGAMTDLDPIVGPLGSNAIGINNAHEVIGVSSGGHGFLYSGGVVTRLDVEDQPPPGHTTNLWAINNLGQITMSGFSTDAFIYDHGQVIDIGRLGFNSRPYDINDAGQVVGRANFGRGRAKPFFYENGQMVYLDTLLPPDSGWSLSDFEGFLSTRIAINNAGQIVGEGFKLGYDIHGFLLTPVVPEPAIFASALPICMALVRRRPRLQHL